MKEKTVKSIIIPPSMSLHTLPFIQISQEWDEIPSRLPPPPPPTSPRATWEDALPKVLRAVRLWEDAQPKTPSPPIMTVFVGEDYDRTDIIWRLTHHWPIHVENMAERIDYPLPAPGAPVQVEEVMRGLVQCRRSHNGNDWCNPELEEQRKMMTEADMIRENPERVSIVTPELQAIIGSHMIREPGCSWWSNGERRNRYVPAGYGVLFRRDEKEMEVLLGPMPPLPEGAKKWLWQDLQAWNKEQRSKIPKMMVTVVYEYGSRRHAEGEPVFNQEGHVIRHRVAGEWTREMIAMLKGTPSPYFFDDFTGHPMPIHSTKAREFRQEVADVAFILQHL